MPADPADLQRGSGLPPVATSTSMAKRRRDVEAQPLQPSLTGSQPDVNNEALSRRRDRRPCVRSLLTSHRPFCNSRVGGR
ncbi:hypothetical protein CABS02_00923 [Colletotrichum abscissum]|uniref:Uncharacterized protein n=1 Tax=Colletotrichum abscissum TaxID=1671311 RepID=A0A9P9XSM1_9PEZI|nr:hypothetical protein CABS02_00923 [Colletotrichum abscissum]